MEFREAVLDDIDDIIEIEKEAFSNTGDVWNSEAMQFSIVDDMYRVFVCIDNNNVVAYVVMTYSPYEAYISKIAVKKIYRNNGYAKKLLEFCINNLDTEMFTLEVRSKNKVAIKLYTNCGFEKAGLREGMYFSPNDDAVVMIRKRDQC